MTKKMKYNWIGFAASVLLVILDQWTKQLAVLYLKGKEPISIWKNVFELHYLENRGAAFGVLQGQKVIFLIGTLLVLVLLIFFYNRLPVSGHFHPLRLVGVLLAAGAVGNMIDRLAQSYVVDFLYFKLIDFPIFNVADCYVTVGAVLMAFLFLFYYKDEELAFLNVRKKYGRKEEV